MEQVFVAIHAVNTKGQGSIEAAVSITDLLIWLGKRKKKLAKLLNSEAF